MIFQYDLVDFIQNQEIFNNHYLSLHNILTVVFIMEAKPSFSQEMTCAPLIKFKLCGWGSHP